MASVRETSPAFGKEFTLFKGQSHGSVLMWVGGGILACLGTGAFPLYRNYGGVAAGIYLAVLAVLAGIAVWAYKRE